jgi:hypothetical protein
MQRVRIAKLMEEGTGILNIVDTSLTKSMASFKTWKNEVETGLQELGIPKEIISNIKVSMHYKENIFSSEESKKKLSDVIENTLIQLKQLEQSSLGTSVTEELSESAALNVIRKILSNFYLHIKSMYQEKVHGNGTLKQEDLAKIIIGNEYDVQRMLYSLIKPIFPSARLEVNDDTGYSGIRYDIYLDNYDIVIETKCSRPKMKIKDLHDELAADGFYYKSKYIFMFIYDKVEIIENADAFKLTFKREIEKDGKNIEVFILQPISL